ncbi:MAG: hypothetical protein BRD45_04360 [Bacteroidetes bacterium QS_8_64_10]|nr:MAG: hypothetical protein BRD45_04360 [Bacteroidetes bacterium QS_8_64_10]
MNTSWHVGLDSGGSKTELLAASPSSEERARLAGPSAHMRRMTTQEAADVLTDLLHEFLRAAPERSLNAVCVGVAGAGRPDERRQLAEVLRAALGDDAPSHLHVVHDGEIALEAAFSGESGAITISGTGSLVLARTRGGKLERAGGWGYLLGDDGSGLSLGRRGLRAVAAAHDGGPDTRLQALFSEQHDVGSTLDLINLLHHDDWPMQQMAPLVIKAAEASDDVARRLLAEETRRLVQQVRWITDRTSVSLEPQLAPLGGLTNEAPYVDAYRKAVREKLPGWTIREPEHPPAVGALRMAQAMS